MGRENITLYQGGINTSTGEISSGNLQRVYSDKITNSGTIQSEGGYIYFIVFYNSDNSFKEYAVVGEATDASIVLEDNTYARVVLKPFAGESQISPSGAKLQEIVDNAPLNVKLDELKQSIHNNTTSIAKVSELSNYKVVNLTSITLLAVDSRVKKVGDIYFSLAANALRKCTTFIGVGSTNNQYENITPSCDAIYICDSSLYIWNGSEIKIAFENFFAKISSVNEINDYIGNINIGIYQGGINTSTGEISPEIRQRVHSDKIYKNSTLKCSSNAIIYLILFYNSADNSYTGIYRLHDSNEFNLVVPDGQYAKIVFRDANSGSADIHPENISFFYVINNNAPLQKEIINIKQDINDVESKISASSKLSDYKASWSTIMCNPYFFKVCSTNGHTYNLNIVINTDFHYNLKPLSKIMQWEDESVRLGIKCFLSLGDYDLAGYQVTKSLNDFRQHMVDVWEVLKDNKYNKPQLVTLGNHDLNVEAPMIEWATKAQQREYVIQPMIDAYNSKIASLNRAGVGFVTDSTNADGCYWYADIEHNITDSYHGENVRIIGTDVFDYPTPIVNTDNWELPDTGAGFDTSWQYWYYSDYIKNYKSGDPAPSKGLPANRRDLGFSAKQLMFLVNALSTVPANYTVIIGGHTFEHLDSNYLSANTKWTFNSGNALVAILTAFKNKQSGSFTLEDAEHTVISFDFTNVLSNKVFMLYGHGHNFTKYTLSNGVKVWMLIATDGNLNKPINQMSATEACDILVFNQGEANNPNNTNIRFVRYGCVGRGNANLANDTDKTADINGFHYVDNPESVYDS